MRRIVITVSLLSLFACGEGVPVSSSLAPSLRASVTPSPSRSAEPSPSPSRSRKTSTTGVLVVDIITPMRYADFCLDVFGKSRKVASRGGLHHRFTLEPGAYTARVSACEDGDSVGAVETEWYREATTQAAASVITIRAGVQETITMNIERPARLGGTAFVPDDRFGGACVYPVLEDGTEAEGTAAFLDPDDADVEGREHTGEYGFSALRAGTYRLRLDDCDSQGEDRYRSSWHGGETADSATPFTVEAGTLTRVDVIFELV